MIKNLAANSEIDSHPEDHVQKDSKHDISSTVSSLDNQTNCDLRLLQDMKDAGIDDVVCNSLKSNDLLTLDGLAYVLTLDVKDIASLLKVTVGQVIPPKFGQIITTILENRQGNFIKTAICISISVFET